MLVICFKLNLLRNLNIPYQSEENKEKALKLSKSEELIETSQSIKVMKNEWISKNPSCSLDSDRCVASCNQKLVIII